MNSIIDLFLWIKVRDGFTLVTATVAVFIILSIVFTVIELRKYRREQDAQIASTDNGGMPDSDNTD